MLAVETVIEVDVKDHLNRSLVKIKKNLAGLLENSNEPILIRILDPPIQYSGLYKDILTELITLSTPQRRILADQAAYEQAQREFGQEYIKGNHLEGFYLYTN